MTETRVDRLNLALDELRNSVWAAMAVANAEQRTDVYDALSALWHQIPDPEKAK